MASNRVRLHLLGEFCIEVGGQVFPTPSSAKSKLLVGYLAVHAEQDVSRSHLAGLIWPDSDPDKALFNLRQSVSRLRKEVPPFSPHLMAPDRSHLRFARNGCLIDVLEFALAASRCDRSALEWYRGPFLASIEDEWVAMKRAELEAAYIRLLTQLIDAASPENAIELCSKALAVDPYREDIARRLMGVHLEMGNPAGAIAVYASLHSRLRADLQIQPSQTTDHLYRQVLASVKQASGDGSSTADQIVRASLARMGDIERQTLAAVSIFRKGWSHEAAASVLGGGDKAEESLKRLEQTGFIEVDGVRSRLSPFAQGFEGIGSEHEIAGFRDRHLDYFHRYYKDASRNWFGRRVLDASDRLEPDLDNGAAAFEWAVQAKRWDAALDLATDLAVVRAMLGYEVKELLERALQATQGMPQTSARKRALACACWCFTSESHGISRGEARRRTIAVAEELEHVGRTERDNHALARALESLGQMWFPWAPEKAERCLREALEIKSGFGPEGRAYFIRLWLARLRFYQGNCEASLSLLEQANLQARQDDNLNALAGIAIQHGTVLVNAGDLSAGIAKLLEGLDTAERIRSDYDARSARLNLLLAYAFAGDPVSMDKHLAFAAPQAREYADALQTDQVELLRRWLQLLQGAPEPALKGLDAVTEVFLAKGRDLNLENYMWASLGFELATRCHLELGYVSKARETLTLADQTFQRDAMRVPAGTLQRWHILTSRLARVPSFLATE